MTSAYSDLYVGDAQSHLGSMAHYGVCDCGLDPTDFFEMFLHTPLARRFERGDPGVVAGMSGIELGRAVLSYVYGRDEGFAEPVFCQGRSPYYWAGWSLAYCQWAAGMPFKELLPAEGFGAVVELYPLFHEMDVTQLLDALLEKRAARPRGATRLKLMREARGMSQAELARASGVGQRSIQMYEQRVNDIDKAQGKTLFRLAWILGCSMEDLLEDPSL